VATYLRYGETCKYEFVANLSLSLSAKEFRKSVSIWGSYGQEFSILFFDSRCSRGVVGRRPPTFIDRVDADASRTPPLFWTEIRAKISPLLQLVTY